MVNIGQRTILVIEDDEAVRASTRTLLEAQGFLVRDFADAESFLATTDGRDAGCIILDQNLTGMSGLDLIAILRAQGVRTPAAIVSGDSKSLSARAAKEGVHTVLRKPLAADALLNWLEQIFSGMMEPPCPDDP
ncbi:MAG TPA: response regulator [Rhizomicrobium sp.]|nr:response regulator [Rhizomicrobium sp.]